MLKANELYIFLEFFYVCVWLKWQLKLWIGITDTVMCEKFYYYYIEYILILSQQRFISSLKINSVIMQFSNSLYLHCCSRKHYIVFRYICINYRIIKIILRSHLSSKRITFLERKNLLQRENPFHLHIHKYL